MDRALYKRFSPRQIRGKISHFLVGLRSFAGTMAATCLLSGADRTNFRPANYGAGGLQGP